MRLLVLAALAGSALSIPRAAGAQASCVLREVEGQKTPGGIDPRLADVRALLLGPPFSQYPSFKLMETHPLTLKRGVAEKGVLTNKHHFEVTFLDRLAERDGKARLRLKLEVRTPDGKPEVSVIVVVDENGAPFPRVEQRGDRLWVQLIHCKST
ncbi:MAG TPA: hypothetical protein VKN99_27150 [Polyangia bacterium]|nr:hypothetical protein [Polyangia bacterium]